MLLQSTFAKRCWSNVAELAGVALFFPDVPCPLSPPTVRYASLGAHEERDQSRKDDLESLLFVFLDLYIGKLPWAEHVSPRVVDRNDELYCGPGRGGGGCGRSFPGL